MALADQKHQSPVALYAEDPRAPRTVKREITKKRDSMVAGLIDGGAKDYANYQWYVGQIAAYNDAIAVCDEAEKDLSGR